MTAAYYIILLVSTLAIYNIQSLYLNLPVQAIAIMLLILSLFSMITFLIKYRKGRLLCFESVFFLIMIVATYIYPAFFYGEVPHQMFGYLDDTIVVKSLFIVTTGLLCYIIGGSFQYSNKEKIIRTFFNTNYNFSKFSKVLSILTLAFIVLFFLVGGNILLFKYSTNISDNALLIANYVLFFIKILLLISTVAEFSRLNKMSVNSMKLLFQRINKLFLINITFIVIFLYTIGDRSTLTQILLPSVLLYSTLINKISLTKLILFFLGVGFLFVIARDIRKLDGGLMNFQNYKMIEDFGVINLITDFLGASAGLYILVDHADSKGYTFGKQSAPKILGAIPFMQSITSKLFDIDFRDESFQSSLDFVTYAVWKDRRSGMGTHLIGDLYYSFGWVGVLVFFVFFGRLMGLIDKRIYLLKSLNFRYLYFLSFFFGLSIYIVRSEFAYPFQFLGFSLIIIWLISKLVPYKFNNKF